MDYLFSFLLFGLNLLDYEIGINKAVFFVFSLVLFLLMFYFIFTKSGDFLCTCLCSMCHVWPYSWTNIFGDPTENLQIPWFYLIGMFILFYFLANIVKTKDRPVNAVMLGVFVSLLVISVYPLLISKSINEGLKEFISICFYIILVFVAFLNSSSFDNKKREKVISAYIYTIAISSALIILQSVLYLTFGETLFKFSIGNYFDNVMASAKLLMEDTSCSTIMLGSGIFFMLERFNRKEKRFLYIISMILTVVGLAFTTRRTSIVSLVVVMVFYVLIYYKGTMKKIIMFGMIAAMVTVMLFYLVLARPIDDYTQLFYENGRFSNYLNSVKIFLENPLGVGYDNVYLVSLMDEGIIAHNTVLRWLDMAGIIFTLLMIAVMGYIIVTAYKKNHKDDFWLIFYCFLAMNFIPDLLNARFFVIPCMLIFLSAPAVKKDYIK